MRDKKSLHVQKGRRDVISSMRQDTNAIWAMIPESDHGYLRLQLSLAPECEHEDMLQEAALATLTGENPPDSAQNHRRRAFRDSLREVCEAKLGIDSEQGSYADALI